jgi:probable HAF family extracellular repeat protein
MKRKLLALTAVVAALAAVTTLAAGGGASPAMADEEMLMMSLMGGGIEDPSAAPEAGLSASTLRVLSTESAGAAGFRSIDVPGAVATRALGINAHGEIVGSYTDAAGKTYGFRWRNGDVTTIAFPGAVHTEAWGINPRGDIVGRYRVAGDAARTFGFLLRRGVFRDISVAGHLVTLPIKITPSGVIVGCVHDVDILRDMHGYVQRGERVKLFEPVGTMHNGVVRGGRLIAGLYFESLTQVHSYVLDRGRYRQFDYPGATFTQAWDVSPSGTVVGYFEPVTSHGFSLDDDGFTQIDVPGASWTRIFGINPQEDMVGVYADATNTVHGFLLRDTGTDEDEEDDEDDG